MIITDRQWKDAYFEEQGVDLEEVEAASNNLKFNVPPWPTIKNPNLLKIETTRTDKQINIKRENYNQSVYIYLTATNMQKAILLDLKEAIPSIITDELTNENSDFKTNITIKK